MLMMMMLKKKNKMGKIGLLIGKKMKYNSSNTLFDHCHLSHSFDFGSIKKKMNLDFYGCFKLINYVRSQVALNRCWSCGSTCNSKQELLDHLHEPSGFENGNLPWDNDMYLQPLMEEDHLLYSFDEDEEVDDEDMVRNLDSSVKIRVSEKADLESSFGIHKEMISDKVRTDAYRQAIVGNLSLLKGTVLLDVGCGTSILSLFAAQAGASLVNAVEASEKMASVASQIAKDNALLQNQISNGGTEQGTGVIRVVNSMVEDLIGSGQIEPHSVDVLVSEWMGYCLLYESMLSSVLAARDHLLKPSVAILPDTATMFVAGFGKGATSSPFWENVYGFNMSSKLVRSWLKMPLIFQLLMLWMIIIW